MSRKIAVSLFVLVIAGMLLSCQAFAETKIKYGGAERMRYEYWGNWLDMDNCQLDTRSFFRFKTSLWGQMDVDQDFTLYAKLTNEFKAYTYFGGATSSAPDKTADKKGYRFDINEVVFDNLYADGLACGFTFRQAGFSRDLRRRIPDNGRHASGWFQDILF
jgi:hypothetical protein